MTTQEVKAEDSNRDFGCGSGTWGRGVLHSDHTLSTIRIYVILSVDSSNGYNECTTGGGPGAVSENLLRFTVGLQ